MSSLNLLLHGAAALSCCPSWGWMPCADAPLVDIVFVHGIRGGAFATWRREGSLQRGQVGGWASPASTVWLQVRSCQLPFLVAGPAYSCLTSTPGATPSASLAYSCPCRVFPVPPCSCHAGHSSPLSMPVCSPSAAACIPAGGAGAGAQLVLARSLGRPRHPTGPPAERRVRGPCHGLGGESRPSVGSCDLWVACDCGCHGLRCRPGVPGVAGCGGSLSALCSAYATCTAVALLCNLC